MAIAAAGFAAEMERSVYELGTTKVQVPIWYFFGIHRRYYQSAAMESSNGSELFGWERRTPRDQGRGVAAVMGQWGNAKIAYNAQQ